MINNPNKADIHFAFNFESNRETIIYAHSYTLLSKIMVIQEEYEAQDWYNDCYPSIPHFVENILQESGNYSFRNPLIIEMPSDAYEAHLLFILWFLYTFNVDGKSVNFNLLSLDRSGSKCRRYLSKCMQSIEDSNKFTQLKSISTIIELYHDIFK